MKNRFKVLGIIAFAVVFVFTAFNVGAQNVRTEETAVTAVRVEETAVDAAERAEEAAVAFIDNGERFISFNWSGLNNKIYSRKLTRDCSVEYIKSKDDDNYTLIIYGKSDDVASALQLLAIGSTDSNWKNRNFVFSVMLVGTSMISVNNESIIILDDGKESGLFRAVFNNVYCIEKSFHTTLTNGIIQVNVKK